MHKQIRNLIAVVGTGLALAGIAASPAAAAVPSPTMNAYCGDRYVSAEGPDIVRLDTRWTVQFRFRVERYTTAGWQPYFTGSWRTASASDWYAPGWYGTSAPANTYMRVLVDQYYYFDGAYQGPRVTIPHHSSAAWILPSTEYCRTN